METIDRLEGFDLENLCVEGCVVKALCGEEIAVSSPINRVKLGTKRYMLTDGEGIPIGVVAAAANRNDSPLLASRLKKLAQFGVYLPEQITVHLDAGYDSGKTRGLLTTLGHDWQISATDEPLQVQT